MKGIKILAAAGLCLALAGCDLLPAEEVFSTAPLLKEYQREEFSQALCERGDIVLTRSISCTYVPVRTEGLKYMVGGLRYDAFYVSAGDQVVEGQLLAQLDLSDIEQNISASQLRLDRLELQAVHLEQDRDLALDRCRIANAAAGAKALDEALEEVQERFDLQAETLQENISIERMRLTRYQNQLAQRQLRAPMDGTVTYVRGVRPGDVSVLGDRVITVADSTMSLFRAETEYWDMLEPGQIVEIISSKVAYEAQVVTEAELGLPETEHVPGEKAKVYFALTEPTFDLEDNDRGALTIVLDSREDVLMVPEKAVATINGETIVYYQDEEGMKAYKPVTVGLTANGMTEIVSGLDEGELVIDG